MLKLSKLIIIDFDKIFKIKYQSIEEIFDFFLNIFDSKKVIIKDILHKNKLIFILTVFDNFLKENTNIEINLLYNNENNYFEKDPKNLLFLKDISEKSYNCYSVDNTFTIFKSINKLTYLIYASENVSIKCYNLNNEQFHQVNHNIKFQLEFVIFFP